MVAPTVRFDNRATTCRTQRDANGVQVAPQDVNNFYLGNVGENYREAADVKKSAYYNLRATFDLGFPRTRRSSAATSARISATSAL